MSARGRWLAGGAAAILTALCLWLAVWYSQGEWTLTAGKFDPKRQTLELVLENGARDGRTYRALIPKQTVWGQSETREVLNSHMVNFAFDPPQRWMAPAGRDVVEVEFGDVVNDLGDMKSRELTFWILYSTTGYRNSRRYEVFDDGPIELKIHCWMKVKNGKVVDCRELRGRM